MMPLPNWLPDAGKPIRTGTFRYVAYQQVEAHHRLGWMVIADLGIWSCLMWRCECKTPFTAISGDRSPQRMADPSD